jgi:hypothetical protein
VREFVVAHAVHWVREYHLDGLRIDATQDMHDDSDAHILAELTSAAREAAGVRRVWIVAESEPQQPRLVRPRAAGGYGLDAVWNDDFHHSAMAALTGRREGYYACRRRAPPRYPLRHPRRPRRRPGTARSGGLPAHLDGRQGRRLGRHTAARQGGRDQRALVQRAPAARGLGGAGGGAAASLAGHAERAYRSFNERFWYEEGGYLYDVVDGDGEAGPDTACRPNQILAVSLRHPALEPSRWPSVLDVVERRLLTPVGLRSLAPGHADYREK